jgi:hypothetical protein
MSHKKYRSETTCLNCGAEVTGKFCSQCGQENIETRENFFHLVGHFVSDYLHFDSKFFRSLIPLFTKPGFLTKQYWEGKRVHYIHPLRLFFFVTIIFMISTALFYNRFGKDLKEKFSFQDEALATLDTTKLSTLPDSAKIFLAGRKDSVMVKDVRAELAKDKRQLRKFRAGFDKAFVNLKYVSFFLLPVYALIFKMLFLRRKSFYVDHLVYAMHLQTFAYCLFTVVFVLPLFLPLSIDVIRQISVISILAYIILSLRYLYVQPWWKTVLKSLIATFALVFVTYLSVATVALIDAMYFEK